MRWLRIVAARIHGLLRREAAEQDIDEELRFHLEMETEANLQRGMTPEEAQRDARRRFGNMGRIKDLSRDIRGGGMLDALLQDLRYGLRMIVKAPVFTLTAVIALALGIGANTAIFSVVNAVLLRPLPYHKSDQLVMLWDNFLRLDIERLRVSPPEFRDYKEQNKVFETVAAYSSVEINLAGGDAPERLSGERVTASLFPLLGVQPTLGRSFLAEDDRPGADHVAILSYGLWQRRFGANPDLIGQTIALNNNNYTVVGIMPLNFQVLYPFTLLVTYHNS